MDYVPNGPCCRLCRNEPCKWESGYGRNFPARISYTGQGRRCCVLLCGAHSRWPKFNDLPYRELGNTAETSEHRQTQGYRSTVHDGCRRREWKAATFMRLTPTEREVRTVPSRSPPSTLRRSRDLSGRIHRPVAARSGETCRSSAVTGSSTARNQSLSAANKPERGPRRGADRFPFPASIGDRP